MNIWISTTEECKWKENTQLSERSGEVLNIGEPVEKTLYGSGCCISEICVFS